MMNKTDFKVEPFVGVNFEEMVNAKSLNADEYKSSILINIVYFLFINTEKRL